MEPKVSLLHSQERNTGPYPEPDQSSARPSVLFLEDPCWYYPPFYAYILQVVSFSRVSPPTFCNHFSSFISQHMSHASFSLSLEFPHQNSICIFPPIPPHTYATCLVNLTLLYLITVIIFDEERIMKLLFMRFIPVPCFFLPLKPHYLPQHPAVEHL